MARVALITGANRGLGFETARQLGQRGIKTIVGARVAANGDAAAEQLRREGIDADSIELDVTSTASVQQATQKIRDKHGLLDILVNNAGILPEATSEAERPLDADMFRRTFETNLLGPVRVIQELLPLLRESSAGRIVNVSTTMGSLADMSDPESPYYALDVPAYRTSKLALNGVTVTLAKLLRDTPIKVSSVCPGWVQTDLAPGNREQAPLTPQEGAQIVIQMATLADDEPTGQFVDREGPIAW